MPRHLIIGSLLLALQFLPLLCAPLPATAQTFTVLHTFTGQGDGEAPWAGVIQDSTSNLYGTTMRGGAFDMGTVFTITASGKEAGHSFWGGAGMLPEGPLIQDEAGNFYGTTYDGGTLEGGSCLHGCGTVFKLDSTGKETVLYAFTGGTDGGNPAAGLVRDKQGNLYGTTTVGGDLSCVVSVYGCGVVFKLDTSGKETVLHAFSGSNGDGEYPGGGLVQDRAGNLYGVTELGGASKFPSCPLYSLCGTVFKIDTAGKETVVHSFQGADGALPNGPLVLGAEGNLYGETELGGDLANCDKDGCGVVFKIDKTGKEAVLYTFESGEGVHPAGGLTRDKAGSLFGATQGGYDGDPEYGTVFALSTNGKLTTLHTFTGGSDGATPNGGLIIGKSGVLYGTTQAGGDTSCYTPQTEGCGVVFKLTP
jgi:uncharacterized repeat protein (TIGR03803 family)